MKFIFTTSFFCMLLLFSRTTLVAQTIALSISGANTGTWTAPTTGGPYFVRITARGGDGGTGGENGSVFAGGGGATLSGIFEVQAGQTIRAISGAQGQSSLPDFLDNGGGGGGGAGAVNVTTNSFLLIAGGGNGAARPRGQPALATAGNGSGGISYDLAGGGGGGGINAPGNTSEAGGGGGGQVSMTDLSGGGFSGGGGSGVGGSGMGGGGGGSYLTSNDGGGGGGQTGGSPSGTQARSLPGGLCQSNTGGQSTLTPQDGYVTVELLSTQTYYQDSDNDGYGNLQVTKLGPVGCTLAGYVSNSTDCDDTRSDIHPGATEIPDDGIDQDCDGADQKVFYHDVDGDGFGNRADTVHRNIQPDGYVTNKDDCNDNQVLYLDSDGDGFGSTTKVACGGVNNNTDFNDSDPAVHLPTLTCAPSITVNNDAGKCGAMVTYTAPAVPQSNSPLNLKVVQTAGKASGETFPVGTTINQFALVQNNTDTLVRCSSTITVKDAEKPVIACPPAQKFCYNTTGSYAIPQPTASDNCGIQSTGYSITGATTRSGNSNNASGVFNTGVSTITWTVKDNSGNQSTCSATVTVNSQITVSVPDVKVLSKGVDANTVYPGYTPAASITLTAMASGGSGNFAYKWSTAATTKSITVSPASATTYTVTVTDGSNCTGTISIQVKAINVGCGGSKVNVCHGGKTLCIDQSSVTDHLNHGDKLGKCGSSASRTSMEMVNIKPVQSNAFASVYPNPTTGAFTLQLNNQNGGAAQLLIIDGKGAITDQKTITLHPGSQTLQLNLHSKASGMYLIQLMNAEKVQTFKVMLQH